MFLRSDSAANLSLSLYIYMLGGKIGLRCFLPGLMVFPFQGCGRGRGHGE